MAREVIRRGGRVVAVARGRVRRGPGGPGTGRLLALRASTAMSASCATAARSSAAPAVHRSERRCPGTRNPAGNDRRPDRAALPPGVRVVAPAANAPYTEEGAAVLRQRGIMALPDFVCNAGAVIGYRSPADATPDQVLARVEATISGLIRRTGP